MTLKMSSVTYGRSKSGQKKILQNLQSDIDRAINYLNGAEYETMIKTIGKYWAGADADKFISELRAMLTADKALFKSYKQTVQRALDADAKYFASGQSTIANSIKRIS